jgi:imidazolonepropionase-like amidohydrolase
MERSRQTIRAGSLAVCLFLLCFGDSAIGQQERTPAGALALVGGTIYVGPTEDPIRDGVVIIRGGKIDAVGQRSSLQIPQNLETLDCAGLTIVAGFWNSHVHFMERQWAGAADIPAAELSRQLQAMLTRYGVTSVFDTGSSWDNTRRLRDRIESGELPGPRIRSTGEILVPKGGSIKSDILDVIGSMRIQTPEIADVESALAASKKLLDAGADGIKLYAATWYPPFVTLPESAMLAASEEAHRRGKPVFAHPTNRTGLLAALRGGADILVHTTPQSGAWDETVLSAMKERGVALIPTLKLWKYELRHDRVSARERFAGLGIGQLRAWLTSGGAVLFGTDVGYMNDYDPSDEYNLMAEAGMSFRQILASLTTAPAQRFGASKQLGRIAPGFTADLVILGKDPSKDVRGFGAVQYTIRDGVVIYRATQ